MTPRQIRIFGLIVLGAMLLVPPLESRCVFAQGRNLFDRKGTTSSPSKPRHKADAATEERLDQIRQSVSSGMGNYLYYVVFLVFLAALVALLVYYDINRRRAEMDGFDNPRRLFRELCAAHRLTAAERKFLRDFAEDADLDDPLPLFIEPRYFYEALNRSESAGTGQMIRYLLVKLFDIKLAKEKRPTSHGFPESGDRHSDTTILVPSHGE